MSETSIGIATAAGETRFSKELLRIWERRYGFPRPERDEAGDRRYREEDVAKLRLLRRLMDRGMRPGRLVQMSLDQLTALMAEAPRDLGVSTPEADQLIALAKDLAVIELRRNLSRSMSYLGLRRFTLELACPLLGAIGSEWEQGSIDVLHEHLLTEALQSVVREAIASISMAGGSPTVILATPSGERHGLGLLMVEALLTLEGALCVPFGIDAPLLDIARVGQASRVDIVGVSISAAYPADLAATVLTDLRGSLPPATELWAGGAGVRRVRHRLNGITVMTAAEEIDAWLANWRASRTGTA